MEQDHYSSPPPCHLIDGQTCEELETHRNLLVWVEGRRATAKPKVGQRDEAGATFVTGISFTLSSGTLTISLYSLIHCCVYMVLWNSANPHRGGEMERKVAERRTRHSPQPHLATWFSSVIKFPGALCHLLINQGKSLRFDKVYEVASSHTSMLGQQLLSQGEYK